MADLRLCTRLSCLLIFGLLGAGLFACARTRAVPHEAPQARTAAHSGKGIVPGKGSKRVVPVGSVAALQVSPDSSPTRYVAPQRMGRKTPLPPALLSGLRRAARVSEGPLRLSLDEARGTIAVLHGDFPQPGAATPADAQAWLEGMLRTLGLRGAGAAQVTLASLASSGEPDGSLWARYGLHYRGLPIFLSELVVHVDARGHLRSVQSAGLGEVGALSAARVIDGAAALHLARAATGPAPRDLTLPQLPAPTLGLWPFAGTAPVLAFRVYLHAMEPAGSYQTYAAYVSATDGQLLAFHAQRASETPRPATGSAQIYDGSTIPLSISRYASSGLYALVDQGRGLASGAAVTFQGRYNQNPSDDTLTTSRAADSWDAESAIVHRHVQLSLDYYKRTHGRSGWDGKGADMPVVAHYGKDYNNAHWSAWDGVIAIGDGDGQRYYPLGRGLDVVAHELTHAVVDASGGLVYQNQSGALNESFADVMAIMVDRDDYQLGEVVAGPRYGRDALRSVSDPAAYGFPAHMRDYDGSGYDYGGVHINSSIINHAAYLLAEASSREVVEQIWYRTMTQRYITSTGTFRDWAMGTLRACEELQSKGKTEAADCESLLQSWAGVGVLSLSDVPGSGCPLNSKASAGLCLCDLGYTPTADGMACVAFADVTCPDNAVSTQGQCYCLDGYNPNADFSACLLQKNACPADAEWNASLKRCVCSQGFEGDPEAVDGECTPEESNCGAHMHPEWRSDPVQNPDDYACLCNEGYELAVDGTSCEVPLGGCGGESFYGRCEAQVLTYCGPNGIETVDCGASGLTCGLLDSLVGFDCLNPNGRGPAQNCDPNVYQQCDADNPFCVEDASGNGAFCSLECEEDADCGAAYGCCATVSDGTRACLISDYCEAVVDTEAVCMDVPGGSTYAGACDRNVLRFCDGSSETTREVNCALDDRVCTEVSAERGFDCVPRDQASLDFSPEEFCPFTGDGVCDVPDRCPEGSDLVDCNPCGDVDALGRCDGDMLLRCEGAAGLVMVDCGAMDAMTCVSAAAGAMCVEDTASPDAGAPDAGNPDAGEMDAAMDETEGRLAGGSVGCSCRVRSSAQQGGSPAGGVLWLLGAVLLWTRRRRA